MKNKLDYFFLATFILILGMCVNISMADVPANIINGNPVFDWTNGGQGGGDISGGPPGTDESSGATSNADSAADAAGGNS